MLSGAQVLGSIDQTLARAQQEASVLDRQVAQLTDRLMSLRHEESEAYRALAAYRLSHPEGDRMIQALTTADERVQALSRKRSLWSVEIDERVAAVDAEIKPLRARRAELAAKVDQRAAELARAEQAATQALLTSEAFARQRRAAEEAEHIARRAEQKTELAEKDRIEKGKPYESDPLFTYLWRRGYGTPQFRAGALTRFFDRRVARLIEFDKARANYGMLQEIPRRLAEHARRRRQEAQEAADHLRALRQAALEKGEPAEKRAALAATRDELNAVDDKIEALESRRAAILAERVALTRGEDEATRQAMTAIETALRRQDLRDLREAAKRTPFPDDDAIVARIEKIERERAQVQASLDKTKALQTTQRQRLGEIEAVRRDYRRRGYDRGGFGFMNGAMLGVLLGELLRGGLTRDGFWDTMSQHHRSWPPADGGLGLPDLGGGFPDFGGGDFGTGGGFGGGDDFRTGGGF